MASPIGVQGTLAVKTDDTGSSISIHISEPAGLTAENLSLSTWGASFILANQLHSISLPPDHSAPAEDSGATERPWMLELGAGTGLVGLSAAAIWGTKVTLTDLSNIIPGLAANISLNEPLLKQSGGSGSCGTLDWTDPATLQLHPDGNGGDLMTVDAGTSKASVILAADTIYSEEHPELLSKTIVTWMAPGPRSRAILCYPLRMAYIDHVREFWELMEAAGLECAQEGRESGDDNWNELSHTPYEWCVWRWKENEGQS
ncbi:uncharacterized protein LTR77_001265 [Saxophila tyrrhenica]|uniref:Uncharacterized protein n=1 Tax=Saxophila tyrrhenica TaxID=1690608 RepID=A0AAV9PKK7_9PEZI|nr:hypothetical protein LTR77_001265 [Saxophila tyrrhenica]